MEAKRQVEYHLAKEFADQNSMKYYESSAKSGSNVEKLFLELAGEIKQQVILTPDLSINNKILLKTFYWKDEDQDKKKKPLKEGKDAMDNKKKFF